MPPSDDAEFDEAIRMRDGATLGRLYRDAADRHEALGETDAACFYLTQAYIWSLEAGLPDAATLHSRLKALGREE